MSRKTGQERTYRRLMHHAALIGFRVTVRETDLWIQAPRDLSDAAAASVIRHRGYIEAAIADAPQFATTLKPWRDTSPQPEIVRRMVAAGRAAGVGPMAAVAGAVAEAVGRDLLAMVPEVVVENGGDVFMAVSGPVTAAIYAGESPLSLKIGLAVPAQDAPVALCTSSGTIGHSLSMGRADAVCVVSRDAALADAAATAIANRIRRPGDIEAALRTGRDIAGVAGIVAVMGKQMGAWGDVSLVRL